MLIYLQGYIIYYQHLIVTPYMKGNQNNMNF